MAIGTNPSSRYDAADGRLQVNPAGGANAATGKGTASFVKKGQQTACVQWQYCGTVGKVKNCAVSVHLG